MFIPTEFLDEEVFPLAHLIILSIVEDFDKYQSSQDTGFQNKDDGKGITASRDLNRELLKTYEENIDGVCALLGFQLKFVKITRKNIFLIVSSSLAFKSSSISNSNQTDISALSSKILARTKLSGGLDQVYELWNNGQINAAMEFVENERDETESDFTQESADS